MRTTDRIILGQDCIYSSNCKETQLNNNILVVGGSGSGKTMSILEPRLLESKNSSLVITLSKRALVKRYKTLFERRGYQVLDLNFVEPDKSLIAYDPLVHIQSYRDIIFLAEAIVKSDPQKQTNTSADPFWDDAAISLLAAEIAYILMTKKERTFTDVLDMHSKLVFLSAGDTITTSMDEKFNLLEKKDPACFAVSCWKTFRMLPIRTAGCVFGALNTVLDTLFPPELKKMISTRRKVDFRLLNKRKYVLFVSSSAVNPALSCFINIFYAQMFKQLFEMAEKQADGALSIPVHVLCDDFATGSTILNFPEYISIFREKRISVTMLLQSESQLASLYGDNNSTTIINNCDTYVYMGGMDIKTGHSISERLNAPLEDVLYMPIGKEVIFRRGQKPIITERYDVEKNRLYRALIKYQAENKQEEKDFITPSTAITPSAAIQEPEPTPWWRKGPAGLRIAF